MFHVKQYKVMKFCLVGYPISHSLSPLVHNEIGELTGIQCEYILEECESLNIDYIKKNYDGFNVTMPFKEKVMDYIDELTDVSKNINSVNTVKIKNGRLLGHSTDGIGFLKDFKKTFHKDFNNKNICILGTGATARSIAYEINKENPKNIFFFSRNKKGENIFSYNNKEIVKECEILVNTTPWGMKENPPLITEKELNEKMIIYDVIYNRKTELLTEGEKIGAKVSNGMGMLIWQAFFAQRFWLDDSSFSFYKQIKKEQNNYEIQR